MHKPLIIAHRGASAWAPENTLAAFRRAVEDGVEGVEFDVRLAQDGVPVVFHDATLGRLAAIRRPVSRMTSGELRQIEVGSWFNRRHPERADAAFSAETIPRLEQVLELLENFSGLVYIELKCRGAEAEPLVAAVGECLAASSLRSRVIVKSFNLEVIPLVRRLCPDLKTAALFAPKIMTMLRKERRLVETACQLGADMISVHFSLATRKLLQKTAARDLPVTVWTTDHPRWIRRALDLGLFALITNDPARLLAARAEILAAA